MNKTHTATDRNRHRLANALILIGALLCCNLLVAPQQRLAAELLAPLRWAGPTLLIAGLLLRRSTAPPQDDRHRTGRNRRRLGGAGLLLCLLAQLAAWQAPQDEARGLLATLALLVLAGPSLILLALGLLPSDRRS
ncbi:MAG: hypothetical protein PHV45_03560 [Desulfuromonas thiophila]|nr:hypothetical protein [Desulfuromonas thiophila]